MNVRRSMLPWTYRSRSSRSSRGTSEAFSRSMSSLLADRVSPMEGAASDREGESTVSGVVSRELADRPEAGTILALVQEGASLGVDHGLRAPRRHMRDEAPDALPPRRRRRSGQATEAHGRHG